MTTDFMQTLRSAHEQGEARRAMVAKKEREAAALAWCAERVKFCLEAGDEPGAKESAGQILFAARTVFAFRDVDQSDRNQLENEWAMWLRDAVVIHPIHAGQLFDLWKNGFCPSCKCATHGPVDDLPF